MLPLKEVPLFGSGLAGKSYVVTRQRRLNCYFELREDKDKTEIACYGTPGLVAAWQTQSPSGLPVRGFIGSQNELFLVVYNQFQAYAPNGSPLSGGLLLSTSAGQCSLTYNGNQVLIVDGNTAYYYTISTNTLGGVSSFPATGARTITFVSGFFVAEQPGTQKFWVSNAFDGTTWNALAFASASSYSSNILAVDNLAGTLILFCELHTEFWQNVGSVPQPFAPVLSAANEFGLAAIFSRAHVDQTIIFLAQTREGQTQFVQLQGFNAQVISNPDIDNIVNGFAVKSDAVGMSYQVDKHKFYQVTFPTANRSFLFDCSTRLWSEVQTGAGVSPTRHQGNLSAYCAGQMFVTDYATNQIYTLSPSSYTDNGQTIAREVITRHVLSNFNRVRISALYLDMESGVGLQSGQGSNPQIMLQYSKDNGRTWSAERWVSIGKVGQYMTRVMWRRFGSTRDATFRIRMTDPVKFVITKGAMRARMKSQSRAE